MARVSVYKRALDAVLTDTHVQDEIKVKEEPVDTPDLNTSEDYILIKNCSAINQEEVLSNHDLNVNVNVNNKENENVSNTCSFEKEKKSFNLKRKRARTKNKQIDGDLLIPKKKQKCSKMFNENTNVLHIPIMSKFQERTRRKCVIPRSKRKLYKFSCNICFREFSSLSNCLIHKQYYEDNGNYKCNFCKKRYIYTTYEELQTHISIYHRKDIAKIQHLSWFHCNFCDRFYRNKIFLQSHVFHTHNELIYSKNIIESNNLKIGNFASVSYENDDLLEKEETSNAVIAEEPNIGLINNMNEDLNESVLKAEKSIIEKSINNKLLYSKQLRQPTLEEYLELNKKKCAVKLTSNKLDMKDYSFATYHDNEKIDVNLEEYNRQSSSPINHSSNQSEQIAHSIVEQNENIELCLPKKPFVRIHADVKMMKSFLEKIIKQSNGDHITDVLQHGHRVPYNLRSLRNISFPKTNINLTKKQVKNISKKSQFNAKSRTKEITDSKVNSNVEKIIAVHFKCKECIIPVRRCDDNTRDGKTPITDITFKKNVSLNEYHSTSSQNDNTQHKIFEVEIPVERSSIVPVDTTIVETISDVEKENNDYFPCKICKIDFRSKSAKREHIKLFHIAYMSSICNARYTTKHKLFQHYIDEHLLKQNQCCVCFVLFPNYIRLKQHLYIHCIKYVQKENDQYPVDIEIKCKSNRKRYKCLQCNKVFLSQIILEIHQSCCLIQNKIADQKDSVYQKKIDNIFKIPHNTNDEITQDETPPNDLCEYSNDNSAINQGSLVSEKQLKISEDNRDSFINNNSSDIERNESTNKLQSSKKSSENDNSTNNNQHTQLDVIDSKIMVYPCIICGKQFQNEKNLQQHIRTFNYFTDVCTICNTAFSSRRLLQSHITAAHVPQISKTYSFHCVFCNQGFVKKYELRPHILHLHGQQMLKTLKSNSLAIQEKSNILVSCKTTCNICNLVFETQDRYIEHTMYYYKNHTFTCSLCMQNFKGMYMFHHHNKLEHYSEDKRKSYSYICEICNEGFNHESHFHSHNMHVHSNNNTLSDTAKEIDEKNQFDPTFKEILGEQIIQNNVLNLFMKQQKEIKQSISNEYCCHICQMKCTNLDDMIKHKIFYSNDGYFKCGKCNRQCKTLDVLIQHKKLTHTHRDVFSGHACHDCGEILETFTSLNYHKKHFHSNIDVSDNMKFKNCNLVSSSTAYERQQNKSNNLENKYKYRCLFCNIRFSSVEVIQRHIVKAHINDLSIKRDTSKLTLSTTYDIDIQEKPILQQIKTDQALFNNNGTQSLQQFNSIIRTMPNTEKQDENTTKSTNSLKVVIPTSGNVIQNVSPVILKNSDVIPTSTVSVLNNASNATQISTSAILKGSDTIPTATIFTLNKKSNVIQNISTPAILKRSSTIVTSTVPMLNKKSCNVVQKILTPTIVKESDTIPTSTVPTLSKEFGNIVQKILTPTILKGSCTIPTSTIPALNKESNVTQKISTPVILKGSSTIPTSTVAALSTESDNVVQKILTPTIVKESVTIPISAVPTLSKESGNVVQKILTPTIVKGSRTIPTSAISVLNKKSDVVQKISTSTTLERSSIIPISTVPMLNKKSGNVVQKMLTPMIVKGSDTIPTSTVPALNMESSNVVQKILTPTIVKGSGTISTFTVPALSKESDNVVKKILTPTILKDTIPTSAISVLNKKSDVEQKISTPTVLKKFGTIPTSTVPALNKESSNVVQKILTPMIVKRSDTIPTSTVPTLSKESGNGVQKILTPTIVKESSTIPTSTVATLNKKSDNVVQKILSHMILKESGTIPTSTVPALNKESGNIVHKILTPPILKESDTIPTSTVPTLNNESSNVVQKILTPAVKRSDVIPISAVSALNKESNVTAQNISTPTIPKTIPTSMFLTLNNESNINISIPIVPAPIPISESIHNLATNTGALSKSGLADKSIASLNSLMSKRNLLRKPLSISTQPIQPIKQPKQKFLLEDDCHFICPLCPLEYPSLMFFHAHMRFAHKDSIRIDMRNPQSIPKTSLVECLLCPRFFVDESRYRKHLKNSHAHYIYIPNSKKKRRINIINDIITTKSNGKKKGTNSEIITIDDNDNDRIKNTSNQRTTETSVTVISSHKQEDVKIGKLKVKSFAKIVEN